MSLEALIALILLQTVSVLFSPLSVLNTKLISVFASNFYLIELDEDDIDLVNEAKGISKSNKRKRLKKAIAKEEEEDKAFYTDEDDDGSEGHPDLSASEAFRALKGPSKIQTNVTSEQMDLVNKIFNNSDDDDEEDIKKLPAPIKKEYPDERLTSDKMIPDSSKLHTDPKFRAKVADVDIPERLYIRYMDRLEPKKKEIEEEALYIYNARKAYKPFTGNEEITIKKIEEVLHNLRIDHYDLPFIATYRCYMFAPELTEEDFTEIYELDLEWNNFNKTKKALRKNFEKIKEHVSDPDQIRVFLNNAMSNNELMDIHHFINFYKKFKYEELSK